VNNKNIRPLHLENDWADMRSMLRCTFSLRNAIRMTFCVKGKGVLIPKIKKTCCLSCTDNKSFEYDLMQH